MEVLLVQVILVALDRILQMEGALKDHAVLLATTSPSHLGEFHLYGYPW